MGGTVPTPPRMNTLTPPLVMFSLPSVSDSSPSFCPVRIDVAITVPRAGNRSRPGAATGIVLSSNFHSDKCRAEAHARGPSFCCRQCASLFIADDRSLASLNGRRSTGFCHGCGRSRLHAFRCVRPRRVDELVATRAGSQIRADRGRFPNPAGRALIDRHHLPLAGVMAACATPTQP